MNPDGIKEQREVCGGAHSHPHTPAPGKPQIMVLPIGRSAVFSTLGDAEDHAERVTKETGEDHLIITLSPTWDSVALKTRYVGVVLETDPDIRTVMMDTEEY